MDEEVLNEIFFENGGKFTVISFERDVNRSDIAISCDIKSAQDLSTFLQDYMKVTGETLKLKFKKKSGEKSLFKIREVYRCHHDTRYEGTREAKSILERNPSKRFRNTFCPFQMSVKVYKTALEDSMTCSISIEHNHNHPIGSLHALSFNEISEETKKEIKSLFVSGMTPSQAYKEFIQNLKKLCNDELQFHLLKANRQNCPRRRDFNALYIKYCNEIFGGRNGLEMFSKLEEIIEQLQTENEELKIKYRLYDKENETALIIAIVTPMMSRVHEMVHQSSEMIFVDSTSNLDEHNLRFFLMCTHSIAGALPLGTVITSDEREETLTKAFEMLKEIMPAKAFFSAVDGPKFIMTDNCDELRKSLSSVWSSSTLLLCLFHILQQVWRWLFEKEHGINKDDRVEIMKLFRKLVYADTEELYEIAHRNLLGSHITKKYPHCIQYFKDLCTIKRSWARCFRKNFMIRGSNTNNYVEAQFLVVKDTILRRQRQFNVNMLLGKLVTELNDHFKIRLLSVADGTFDGVYSTKFKGTNFTKITDSSYNVDKNISQIDEYLYLVRSRRSEDTFYLVDMAIGRCECFCGIDGSPCWHQFIIWSKRMSSCPNFLPHFNPAQKKKFADIAIGASLESHYYASIHDVNGIQEYSVEDMKQSASNTPDNTEIDAFIDNHTTESLNTSYGLKETAKAAFERFSKAVDTEIETGNTEFLRSIVKFTSRYETFSVNQRISSFQNFGKLFTGKSRSRIKVQPTAVARRKSKIGSRQKQSNVSTKSLPTRPITRKRKHDLSEVITLNVPSAKKAGRSMISNTKYFVKKETKKTKKNK